MTVAAHMREVAESPTTNRVVDFIEKACFIGACVLWLSYTVLNSSLFGGWIQGAGLNIVYFAHAVYSLLGVVEFIRIWRGEYGKREAFFLALIIFMVCRDIFLVYEYVPTSALILFSARKYNIRWLCPVMAGVVCATALVVIVASQMGVIQDVILDPETRVRHYLGFRYCLYPPQYLFSATLVICWLRAQRFTIWEAIALIAANVFLFYLTDSRISFALSVIAVVGTLLYRLCMQKGWSVRGIARVLVLAFVLAALLTIVVMIMYFSNPYDEQMVNLDRMLTGRVWLGYQAIVDYGITPFGKPVEFIGNGLDAQGQLNLSRGAYNYVDNTFINIAVRHGLVYAIALVGLFTATSARAFKEHDYTLVFVIALIAVESIFIDLAVRVACDALMFAFASLGRPTRKQEEEEGDSHLSLVQE